MTQNRNRNQNQNRNANQGRSQRQSRNADSFFRGMAAKWAGPVRIWVFTVFLGFVIVGAVFFAEDTWSSYQGILALEQKYELNAVSWEYTYWAGAIVAQLLQMGFMYIFLAEKKKNYQFLIYAAIAFSIDFALDAVYRSNGYIGGAERLVAIGANTTMFSALSEILITLGIGSALTLAPGAFSELAKLFGYTGRKPKPQPKQQQRPQSNQRNQRGSRPAPPPPPPTMSREEIERQMDEVLGVAR